MKTTVLLAGLGGLIVAVAGLLGGGSTGALMIGLLLALVMVGGSYWFSDKLALRSARAEIIEEHQAPEFYAMVRSLAERPTERVRHRPRATPRRRLRHAGPVDLHAA